MNKKIFLLGLVLAGALRAEPDLAAGVHGMHTDPMGYKKYVTFSDKAIHITHLINGATLFASEKVTRSHKDKYGGLVVHTNKSIYKIYEHGESAYMLYVNDADGTPRAALLLKKGGAL
jgi:hypothetical protein